MGQHHSVQGHDPAIRQAMIDGAAASIWLEAWAASWEGHGGSFFPHQAPDGLAPPVPLVARLAAAATIGAFEAVNGCKAFDVLHMSAIAERGGRPDRDRAFEFGRAIASAVTGSGPGPFAGHPSFRLVIPSAETVSAIADVDAWLERYGPRIPYRIGLTASSPESDVAVSAHLLLTFEEADALELRLHEISEWMDSNGFPVLHAIQVDPAPGFMPGFSPEGAVSIAHMPEEGCDRLSALLSSATGIQVDPAMLHAAIEDASIRSFPNPADASGESLCPA